MSCFLCVRDERPEGMRPSRRGRPEKAAKRQNGSRKSADSPHDRNAQGPAGRAARCGFQPAVSAANRSSNSQLPSRCSIWTSPCRCSCFSIASWSALENRARIVDAAEIAYREGGEVIFEEVSRATRLPSARRTSPFSSARSNARTAIGPGESPSRVCSASITPSAPARAARDSATPSTSIMNLVIPDKGLTLKAAQSIRGTGRSTEPGLLT